MPEGDTIHRAARHLSAALLDQAVTRFWAYRPQLLAPRREGHVVTAVEARGKNLLMHFSDQRALYTHMKMTGSWHVYRPGEPWRKPEPYARVVLETAPYVAVCFSAPTIELLTEPEVTRHPTLSTLGPDLLAADLDVQEILRRFGRVGEVPLGEAVMDQRILAGIGNVYKSEMLFLGKLSPFAPVSAIPPERLERLVHDTRRMMTANLDTWRRTTRRSPGSRVWVYERRGQPCFQCRSRIQMQRQGTQGRSTYYCPKCQTVAATARPARRAR